MARKTRKAKGWVPKCVCVCVCVCVGAYGPRSDVDLKPCDGLPRLYSTLSDPYQIVTKGVMGTCWVWISIFKQLFDVNIQPHFKEN